MILHHSNAALKGQHTAKSSRTAEPQRADYAVPTKFVMNGGDAQEYSHNTIIQISLECYHKYDHQ